MPEVKEGSKTFEVKPTKLPEGSESKESYSTYIRGSRDEGKSILNNSEEMKPLKLRNIDHSSRATIHGTSKFYQQKGPSSYKEIYSQQISENNSQQFLAPPGKHSLKRVRQGSNASQISIDQMSQLSVNSYAQFLKNGMLDDDTDTCLILSRIERLPLKDFSAEVRASLDIEIFIKEAVLLLDIDGTSLESIINTMLEAIFHQRPDFIGSEGAELDGNRPSMVTVERSHFNLEQNHWSRLSQIKLSVGGSGITPPSTTPNSPSTVPNSINQTNECQMTKQQLIMEAKKALYLQAKYQDQTYQRLAKTIKGISLLNNEGLSTDQSWICTMCSMNFVNKRHLALARLCNPVNLGRSNEGTNFIILVITPTREKGTKTEIELGRTFATILSDLEFRQSLLYASDENEVKSLLWSRAHELAQEQAHTRRKSLRVQEVMHQAFSYESKFLVGNGIASDFKRRIKYYPSDITDGIKGNNTVRKVISTSVFLYFACLLPSLAFGVLNSKNTNGKIDIHKFSILTKGSSSGATIDEEPMPWQDVRRILISQFVGGLCFGLFGGQPLIILLSTAPLALYTKILFEVAHNYQLDFYAFYGCVGLFTSFLIFIYAVFGLSRFMRWSTRSTEEIFAFFVALAFLMDSWTALRKEFQKNYFCSNGTSTNPLGMDFISNLFTVFVNKNVTDGKISINKCHKDVAVLYLLLMLGTVWMAVYLLNFTKTPFLTAGKREIMTDFALPLAVLVMSFFGTYVFRDIKMKMFPVDEKAFTFQVIDFQHFNWRLILIAFCFAFPLSLLFFMEQNIASAMVNSPANKLRKGAAYHWDLMVIGVINTVLSLFALPWVHGALPHSPLHVRALADIEERIDMGHHVQQTIVRVRETRVTAVLSHIGIALSLWLLPFPLQYIPRPVLNGLFVYMAITAVNDNQLFERVMLLFTEQAAYPPSHYLRRVPQRKLHLFTILQLIQLVILCAVGFTKTPFIKMVFPILLILQIVIRQKLIPYALDDKYLEALDRPI